MKDKTMTELYEELDILNDWIENVANECADNNYVDLDKWPPTAICNFTGKPCSFDCCPKRRNKK